MKIMEERQVEMWNDIENTEENTEKIWKICKKGKSNSEMNRKIQMKIVKWYGKYGRKINWMVKWFGKYGRKASQIMKRFGKYRRKQWKDMEIMKER